MKKTLIGLSLLVLGTLPSCKKDISTTVPLSPLQQAVLETEAIDVGTSPVTAGDSVYVVNTIGQHDSKDSIAYSALPSPATDYLNNNYTGYTPWLAFDTKDSTGNLNGYLAVFEFNNRPVGIKFDTGGTFIKVLEESEGEDLLTTDWHTGGLFDGRDGMHRDSVAVSALPAAAQSYFTNNFPTDSLLNAFVSKSGNYFVISQNSTLFVSIFAGDGTFISRLAPPEIPGNPVPVINASLPTTVSTVLSASYPGYYLENSFVLNDGSGSPTGYSLIFDENNTTYGMDFDASGNFVNLKVIQ